MKFFVIIKKKLGYSIVTLILSKKKETDFPTKNFCLYYKSLHSTKLKEYSKKKKLQKCSNEQWESSHNSQQGKIDTFTIGM